jgi:hypothetical protein
MSSRRSPQHTSLEREFFAAVPPAPVPWTRLALWQLILRVLQLRFVQRIIEKKYLS